MMGKYFGTLLIVFILLYAPGVIAGENKPLKFKCDDGKVFTITFVKEKGDTVPMKARLVFSKSKTTLILDNQAAGSGSAYGDGRYEFLDHHGDVSLVDFTRKGKGNMVYETPCHEVK